MTRRPFRTLGLIAALVATAALASAQAQTEPVTTTPEASTSTIPDTLPPEIAARAPTVPPRTASTQSPLPTAATATTPTAPTETAPLNGPPVPTSVAPTVVALADSLIPVCQSAAGAGPLPVGPTLGCRIIASYGNPLSKGMGILGRLPLAAMMKDNAERTAQWAKADPARIHRCAFELIAVTVQASAGASGLYRARMPATLIDTVLGWARSAGCLLILDVQVGWSSVPVELPFLEPWLAQNDVHLALDPEWDMAPGVKPGTRIGTMSSADVNVAVDTLTRLVKQNRLAPKLLIVHRFRDFMVTLPDQIRTPPEIRLLVNMDGFGTPPHKLDSYRVAQRNMPTTLTGFKLFTLIDRPMLQPADVLPIRPVPVFINYQ